MAKSFDLVLFVKNNESLVFIVGLLLVAGFVFGYSLEDFRGDISVLVPVLRTVEKAEEKRANSKGCAMIKGV